jgi:hypothetical protein
MSSVGPELPPHLLAKRKRQAEEKQQQESEAKPESPKIRKESPSAQKRRRVLGPSLPAPLAELPKESLDSDSSSDDDYGPSLPTGDEETVRSELFIDQFPVTNYSRPLLKQKKTSLHIRATMMLHPKKPSQLATPG